MTIRLVKGNRTIAIAETVLQVGDWRSGTPEEERVVDVSARAGHLDLPSERPSGNGVIRTFEGTRGRTVIESVCLYAGYSIMRYWVRRIEGPWPTEEELMSLVDGGAVNFGGTVDIRTEDVGLVEVFID